MSYLDKSIQRLADAGISSARLDTFLILNHVTHKNREWFMAHPGFEPSPTQQKAIDELLVQRAKRIPLAYLLGKREFYGLDFAVDDGVLVPRPETEDLVSYAIENSPKNASVLELGTGSGAIALALAKNRPDLTITATDISQDAIKIADKNAEHLNLEIDIIESDLFSNISDKYQVILANLPYVPVEARRQPEITHEPDVALYGGSDGLDYYRTFTEELHKHLEPGGFSVVEFSPTQYASMRKICDDNNFKIEPISEYIFLIKKA